MLSGFQLLRDKVQKIAQEIEASLREMPSVIERAGVDVLLVDEIVLSGPTIAEMMHLPYVAISTSVPHCFGWEVSSKASGLHDKFLQLSVFNMRGPVQHRLDEYRRAIGLGSAREVQQVFPPVAYLTQLPQCLDLPRETLPANFYYVGPLADEKLRLRVEFPFEHLDGRRLIYASLGTARAIQLNLFNMIAEASARFDVQLALSLGGRGDEGLLSNLPGRPLVVKEAPQLELIKKADVIITHGGLNTALEALSEGKPMVIIPMGYDQPSVAARLKRLKVAEIVEKEEVSEQTIYEALLKILGDRCYRDAAVLLQKKISHEEGIEGAVHIIENKLANYIARYRS